MSEWARVAREVREELHPHLAIKAALSSIWRLLAIVDEAIQKGDLSTASDAVLLAHHLVDFVKWYHKVLEEIEG